MKPKDLIHRARSVARPRTRYAALVSDRRRRRRLDRQAAAHRRPLENNRVLYESFNGNGVLCNPEALFRAVLAQPDLQHLHHVWVLDALDKHPEVVAEFTEDPRVSFVELNSVEYLEQRATAKYLVNNATFGEDFAKRPGQVYVNTWHGTPLKKMGYDTPQGGAGSSNILRNLMSADYLVSAAGYATDTMYRSAFRLQGLFRGTVIEEGQPRTDLQWQTQEDRQMVLSRLVEHGLDVEGRRILLYAPTWKGSSMAEATVNADELLSVVRHLQASVDSHDYVVLLKAHQVIYDALEHRGVGRSVLVPNDLPTNSILGVTDLLVTDYSSILFDFLPTGRPVLHHVPDMDAYATTRGIYLAPEELFGPISRDVTTLAENLAQALASPEATLEGRTEAVQTYAPHDDGSVSERVVDIVFRGNADADRYRLLQDFATGSPTMLVYVGGLTSNGLTSSALNLVSNLDHDRIDVSVLHSPARSRDQFKNQALVPEQCRVFVRRGQPVGSTKERALIKRLVDRGLPDAPPVTHHEYWEREWCRVFGNARFDYALDLSGYGASIPYLFSAGEIGTRALWLHSDLMADSERETNGEKHLKERLHAVFSCFRLFDRLVSVSADLEQINAEKLKQFAPREKFTHANNTLDFDRILRMAGRPAEGASTNSDAAEAVPPAHVDTIDTTNIASAVTTLLEHFEAQSLLAEVRSHVRGQSGQAGSTPTFVTVGRLSPEKNHARLLRAFAMVHEHTPDARLVIVGSGKLHAELRQLSKSLGIRHAVNFAGQVANPYVAMAQGDCFVLSSNYEGQPMVVLEARALGLPIISTRFDSVGSSVPPEAGLVVDQTDEALAEGMRAFLDGEVAAAPLDFRAYNREAMRQVYAAIGLDRGVGDPV